MKKGLLIVYSGPSGVGKSTVRQEFFKDESLKLTYSISMTTRAPREGEQEGVDYFFVSQEEFKRAVENDELLEHAEYVNNYYGTPKFYVEKLRNEGKNVILEIDIEGGKQVIKQNPDCVSIFLVPPSIEVLKERIMKRGSESEETLNKRVEVAKKELEQKELYKYVVVSDTIERTASEIKEIIRKEMNK